MSTFGTSVIGTGITSSSGAWHGTFTYTFSGISGAIASYDIAAGTEYGLQIHSGNVLKVNGSGDGLEPHSYKITHNSVTTHYSNDDGVIAVGDVVTLHNGTTASSSVKLVFTVTVDHVWTTSSGGGTSTEGGGINPLSNGSSGTQKKVFCNFW